MVEFLPLCCFQAAPLATVLSVESPAYRIRPCATLSARREARQARFDSGWTTARSFRKTRRKAAREGPMATASGTDPRLLLLDDRDSVLVVASRIREGESFLLEGVEVVAAQNLPLGHKVARRPIAEGEKVLKYGVPIGTATVVIAAGAHAHVHNIRSDYTPTYHLIDAQSGTGGVP
jgi:hypothetical protein